MSRLSLYIAAARPRTLPASLGPVLVGFGLAGTNNLARHWLSAFGCMLCALLLQASANLVNDYYDAKNAVDGDDRLGPVRATASGLLAPEQVRLAFMSTLGLSALIGLGLALSGGLPIVILGVLSIIFAFIYTGGPLPLSYIGMGELLAFIFFGPVATWGSYYLLTHSTDANAILVGCAPGLVALAIMAINNMRDRISDARSGKRTMAVIFGEKFARTLPLISISGTVLIPIYFCVKYQSVLFIICSMVSVLFLNNWRRIATGSIDKRQNRSLTATGRYGLVYCLVLMIILFIKA